ncbi:neuroglobin [Xylocopa sonorina]|uniref:neuroglobin n=1 Tax=Xylocopa sonorina TaxID=1818115 RepID=UPI00403AF0D6
MGCELSKLATPKAQNQTTTEPNATTEANPTTDPRLPLTAKQKYTVMASWKAISRELVATGVFMLMRLFEEHEELVQMFSRFLDLKAKEECGQQFDMVELKKHAEKVMAALDESIKGLDDMDVFLTCLHQVGATHTKIPGFNAQYFWKIEQPFLQAVQQTLQDRYSENVESIYKITIKFIIETLIEGFNKAQNNKAQSTAANS